MPKPPREKAVLVKSPHKRSKTLTNFKKLNEATPRKAGCTTSAVKLSKTQKTPIVCSCASGRVGGSTMDERQSRKLRQLQAEMIALANDREKATSADECRAIDAKLRALAERGAAMKHVKMSPEEKPCAACKRPTARTVVSEGRAHRFCSVECASSRDRIKACRLDGVEVAVSF